jgi:hypothetical protein
MPGGRLMLGLGLLHHRQASGFGITRRHDHRQGLLPLGTFDRPLGKLDGANAV